MRGGMRDAGRTRLLRDAGATRGMRGAGARCRAERRPPAAHPRVCGGRTRRCAGDGSRRAETPGPGFGCPSSPSVPGCPLRGAPQSGGWAGRGCDLTPPSPPARSRGGSVHLSALGISGACPVLPVPPHQGLPSPPCSAPLSPTTREAIRSPEIQSLSPLHCPYKAPPKPHTPAPLPAVSPAPGLQHTGSWYRDPGLGSTRWQCHPHGTSVTGQPLPEAGSG